MIHVRAWFRRGCFDPYLCGTGKNTGRTIAHVARGSPQVPLVRRKLGLSSRHRSLLRRWPLQRWRPLREGCSCDAVRCCGGGVRSGRCARSDSVPLQTCECVLASLTLRCLHMLVGSGRCIVRPSRRYSTHPCRLALCVALLRNTLLKLRWVLSARLHSERFWAQDRF
jgi:hypothetical protein